MKRIVILSAAVFGLSSCGAAKWTYQKTRQGISGAAGVVTGAGSYVVKGTKKLWPFGGKKEDTAAAAAPKMQDPPNPKKVPQDAVPAASPAVAANPAVAAAPDAPPSAPASPPPAAEPSVLQIAKSRRYVDDALLGGERREETNSSVPLPDGWRVQGSRLHYRSDYLGDPASALRAEGRPARATKEAEGKTLIGQGREIHYRQDTGILTLKGFPALQIGGKKITAADAGTEILVHLPTGAFHAYGPVTTTSE